MRVIRWQVLVAFTGALISGGCSGDATRIDGVHVTSEDAKLASPSVAGGRYLARGEAVPANDTLRLLPAPYDPRLDGPSAQGKGLTRVNLATAPRLSRAPFKRASGSPPAPTNGNAALFLLQGRGVSASVSAGTDIVIPLMYADSLRLYAPTHIPHGGSCLEVSSVHWRVGYPYVNNMIGIWDWCIPGAQNFAAYLNMDDFWARLKYFRDYTDEFGKTRKIYMLTLYASNPSGADYSSDTWTMLLYNFQSGAWEVMYSSSGVATDLWQLTVGDPKGWSMWESKGLVYAGCPSFPSQTAQNLQVRIGTNWQMSPDEAPFITPIYSGCGYTWIRPWGTNYGWIARTPNM